MPDGTGQINGIYEPNRGETFIDPFAGAPDTELTNLDVYLMPAGAQNLNQALWSSNSTLYNVEHMFFKLPAAGNYEIWVRQTGASTHLTNYALAWWGEGATVVGKVEANPGEVQRSEVRSLTVTFSQAVTFAGGNSNAAAAFHLQHISDLTGPLTNAFVNLHPVVSTDGLGRTVVTLTFSGSETDLVSAQNGGMPSLADGRYQLTIVSANITGATDGLALDGDADGMAGGDYVSPDDTLGGGEGQLQLFRIFGDVNGDGIIDQLDLGIFRSAFNSSYGDPLYLYYLDADNNAHIDQVDLGQFRSRFNGNVFIF